MTNGTPYPATHWPTGTSEADKAECLSMAKGGCELSRSEDELAKAIAMIGGPVRFTRAVRHGEQGWAIVDAELAA